MSKLRLYFSKACSYILWSTQFMFLILFKVIAEIKSFGHFVPPPPPNICYSLHTGKYLQSSHKTIVRFSHASHTVLIRFVQYGTFLIRYGTFLIQYDMFLIRYVYRTERYDSYTVRYFSRSIRYAFIRKETRTLLIRLYS